MFRTLGQIAAMRGAQATATAQVKRSRGPRGFVSFKRHSVALHGSWFCKGVYGALVPFERFCGHSIVAIEWLLDHGAVDVYANSAGLFPVYERETRVPVVRR